MYEDPTHNPQFHGRLYAQGPGPYPYGGQPGPYSPPPVQSPAPKGPRKRMPLWGKVIITVGAGFMLLAGGCTALVVASGAAEEAASRSVPSAPVSTYDPGLYTPEPKATTQPATPARKHPAPALVPQDGTLLVGKDVKPGTYQTRVLDGEIIPRCYWARLRDLEGRVPGSIIDNDLKLDAGALMTVTVKRTDYALEIDCAGAEWTRIK
jgi:hypothetical protein